MCFIGQIPPSREMTFLADIFLSSMDLFTYCSFVVCCGKFVCVSAPILLMELDLGLEGRVHIQLAELTRVFWWTQRKLEGHKGGIRSRRGRRRRGFSNPEGGEEST